jgi:hypothetical protein
MSDFITGSRQCALLDRYNIAPMPEGHGSQISIVG